MTVGEAALGAFLQVLFQMIALPIMELFTPFLGLNKQVKRLRDVLLMIHGQIQAADEEANEEWLDKLKDAAYDMEDILDEINAEYLLLDVENRKQGGEPLLTKLAAVHSQDKKSGFRYPANLGRFLTKAASRLRDRTKKKIQDALDKLEEAARSRDTLGLGKKSAGGEISANPTTGRIETFPRRSDPVYGRHDERQKLLDMIREETSHSSSGVNYSVVTILGMGGIGKTALTRLIYKDAERFDLKSWVCAPSIRSDSLIKLVGDILSQLTNSDNQHGGISGCNLHLGKLLNALESCLKNKKFLIVIDDVWTVDKSAWKDLYTTFQHCGEGSKIVVTTQKEDVAKTMGSRDLYRLQKLEDKHCCELFIYEACRGSYAEVKGKKTEEEIAKKCRGVPLVADVLGTILSCNNPEEISWKDISDIEIWNSPDHIKKIFPCLKMCYYDLPSELKRCFEYFSLFPKDYPFNQDNLVQMWLAEGFVLPKRISSEQVEYVMNLGGNCYKKLKDRSLLCDDGNMPEILLSLACYIARNFYYKHDNHLISSEGLLIGSPRHVSFLGKDIEETALDSLKACMKLRTILADSIPSNCLDRLLAWRILRVLELGNSGLSVLPPSIGELKHLRYLSLHSSDIESLPDTICSLCNLQTLDLHSCVKLAQLPSMMGDLVSLHHLNLCSTGLLSLPDSICGATKLQRLLISDCPNLTKMPPLLGNLTGLRDLSNYLVSKNTDCGIRELKRLSHLKGPLIISGLEHVTDVDDAQNTDLKGKEDLEGVTYMWSRNRQASNLLSRFPDKIVLRALEPSSCRLKSLSVDGYGDDEFPEWLSEMINLKHLRLDHCLNITNLPEGLSNLKSLRSLYIKNCRQFNIELQPFLNAVHNLKFLQQLEVESINFDLTSTKLWIKEYEAFRCLPNGLHRLTSLQSLRITDCSQLQSLCDAPLPTTLEELCITGCQNLQSLQCGFLHLTSLQSLKITNCKQLRSVCEDELPATLIELGIQDCKSLQSLPQRLHNLTDLQCLKVNGSSNIYPLLMELCKCPSLKKLGVDYNHLESLLAEDRLCLTLEKLCVWGYDDSSLPAGWLQNLASLSKLKIAEFPHLKSMPEGSPTTLKIFFCAKCPNLSSLSALRNLTTLEEITVRNCPQLDLDHLQESFPNVVRLRYE